MCINHFDQYNLCSHSISYTIPCAFKQANPYLQCTVENAAKCHDDVFCPREACQKKNREIEEANEREAKEKEEQEERESVKSENSLRHKASRKFSKLRDKAKVKGKRAVELIERDLRNETPNPFTRSKNNSTSTASPTVSGLVENAYPLPAVVGRRSLPVKPRKDPEPFVGDLVKAYSMPVASSTAITEAWVETTATLQDNASAISRPHSNGDFEYVKRESLTSTGSGIHAQTYRNLIGDGPYDNNDESALPTTPGVYREPKLPERQPSYKKAPSPPGNFRRGPSQTSTPRGSPPFGPTEQVPSQSSRSRALTPPKQAPSLAKKDPRLYYGQPTEREIVYTKSGKQRSPTQFQKNLPQPTSRRQVLTTKPLEDDRMSIVTTFSAFIPNPMDNNVESRREGSKLADGTYDHRRLEQGRQRKLLRKPYQPSKLGNGKTIPMQIQLAAKKSEVHELGVIASQVMEGSGKGSVSATTAWPEPAQYQEEEHVPQRRRSPRLVFAERQASEERKRMEALRPTTTWPAGDESYFGLYAKQGGISQEVSPSSPNEQQLDYRSSQRTSSDYQQGHPKRARRLSQNLSPPRTDTSKQTSFPKRTYSNEQVNTQRRGRCSPQNTSPPRTELSTQSSFSQRVSPDNQVDTPKNGRRSPQNLSLKRTNSSRQASVPQTQNHYQNWGQDSHIDKEAARLACERAELEQERIKNTALREMQEKLDGERKAAEEASRVERQAQAKAQYKKEAKERKAAEEKLAREKEEQVEARMKTVQERKKAEAAARKEAEEVEALRQADLSALRMRDMRSTIICLGHPKGTLMIRVGHILWTTMENS